MATSQGPMITIKLRVVHGNATVSSLVAQLPVTGEHLLVGREDHTAVVAVDRDDRSAARPRLGIGCAACSRAQCVLFVVPVDSDAIDEEDALRKCKKLKTEADPQAIARTTPIEHRSKAPSASFAQSPREESSSALFRVCIQDLGSSNGTFVNFCRIDSQKPTELCSGDSIVFGGDRYCDVGSYIDPEVRDHPNLTVWAVDIIFPSSAWEEERLAAFIDRVSVDALDGVVPDALKTLIAEAQSVRRASQRLSAQLAALPPPDVASTQGATEGVRRDIIRDTRSSPALPEPTGRSLSQKPRSASQYASAQVGAVPPYAPLELERGARVRTKSPELPADALCLPRVEQEALSTSRSGVTAVGKANSGIAADCGALFASAPGTKLSSCGGSSSRNAVVGRDALSARTGTASSVPTVAAAGDGRPPPSSADRGRPTAATIFPLNPTETAEGAQSGAKPPHKIDSGGPKMRCLTGEDNGKTETWTTVEESDGSLLSSSTLRDLKEHLLVGAQVKVWWRALEPEVPPPPLRKRGAPVPPAPHATTGVVWLTVATRRVDRAKRIQLTVTVDDRKAQNESQVDNVANNDQPRKASKRGRGATAVVVQATEDPTSKAPVPTRSHAPVVFPIVELSGKRVGIERLSYRNVDAPLKTPTKQKQAPIPAALAATNNRLPAALLPTTEDASPPVVPMHHHSCPPAESAVLPPLHFPLAAVRMGRVNFRVSSTDSEWLAVLERQHAKKRLAQMQASRRDGAAAADALSPLAATDDVWEVRCTDTHVVWNMLDVATILRGMQVSVGASRQDNPDAAAQCTPSVRLATFSLPLTSVGEVSFTTPPLAPVLCLVLKPKCRIPLLPPVVFHSAPLPQEEPEWVAFELASGTSARTIAAEFARAYGTRYRHSEPRALDAEHSASWQLRLPR